MAGFSMVLWQIGGYFTAGFLVFFTLNFLTKGFIFQYLKTKLSRGKYVLVKCHAIADSYYRVGHIDNKGSLIVKDLHKKVYSFDGVDTDLVSRELGVNQIEVNLKKGCIIKRDFSGVNAYDVTLTDEMISRAAMLPRLESLKEKVEQYLIYLIIIGVAACIYLLWQQPDMIVEKLTPIIKNVCVAGGNI